MLSEIHKTKINKRFWFTLLCGHNSAESFHRVLCVHRTLSPDSQHCFDSSTTVPLQKFSWAFVFSWESHEILMRKWLSHENFRNLMRIFHEVFRSWEFHFSHEKLFFLMRIEKAHETFPRSREILYPTHGVFEKSSWGFSQAILSASYIFPLPPFSNLIQIIILCSSPQASSFPLSQSVIHTPMVSITTVDKTLVFPLLQHTSQKETH